MTTFRRLASLPLLIALLALLAVGGVLLWSSTVQAQTATALVKNTGQSAESSTFQLNSSAAKRAQAFTTGSHNAGYTLNSIGLSFGDIAEITTAGAQLTVTLNQVSSGDPGSVLCTLTDPAAFTGAGVQTFDAPAADPCPTLTASTTYFAVIERVVFPDPDTSISLTVTTSGNEDSGGAMGWTIGDAREYFGSGSWTSTASQSHLIEVKGVEFNNLATGAPTITGTPRVGEELTAGTSAIMDADGLTTPGYSYQWVRVDDSTTTNIGTDSSTYTLVDDDGGKQIRVDVTFTDDESNTEGPLSSALTDAVNSPATGAPSISGVLEEDEVLTADTAGIADADGLGVFSYQWLADGTAISDATSSTHTLTADEVGKAISLTVTFTDPGNFPESLTSAATPAVVASGATRKLLWVGTLTPADAGRGFIGFDETSNGSLSPPSFIDGSITYAFEVIEFNSVFGLAVVVKPGPGATERVKWIIDAGGEFALFDAAHTVGDANVRSVWLPTFGDPGWSIGTETVVYLLEDLNNRATGAPSISGVLQQDEVLTADTVSIADADGLGDFSYQWLADGTAISGATSSTYTLTADEVGKAISLTVTFTDGEDFSESLTSAATHNVVATGATRRLLWLGTLTPTDRLGGTVGTNLTNNEGSLIPHSFTYGSDTYAIDIMDFGPAPTSGLSIIMGPVPGAGEEDNWIFDTGREWHVSDITPNTFGGQISMLWSAMAGDIDWMIGVESVVYLLEVVNNPPEFTDTAPATRSVNENSASATSIGSPVAATDPDADTLVYGLAGTDASSFSIDSTSGQLKTSASLDFETKSSYSVDVTVHDGRDAIGNADTTVDATIAVTISVSNVDEAGTVTLPATFSGGVEATASVTDPDGTVSSPSWQWARGDTATGSFTNISGATSASYTPVGADVGKYLRATVTYTDPEGSGKTASAVSSSAVGASNAEPEFSTATATRTLPENSGAGVDVVGGTVTATDGDSDTLIYSLTGTDAARFEIDSSGQIKVKTGSTHTFDFESSKKSYSVTVNVRDSKDAAGAADTAVDDTITVTIDLTNVNEAPVIANTEAGISRQENTTFVIAFSASDVDASTTLSWSIESTADGGKFEINATTGVVTSLSFKNAPDFETPTDVGDTAMNNTYVVTIKVTDDGSPAMSDMHTFTVTVTNVNEAPTITTAATTYANFDVAENTATSEVIKTYEAEDLDAGSVLTWDVLGVDAGDFTITKNADGHGELKFANAPNFESPSDAGANNVYDVAVRVSDAGLLSSTITVQVTVTDVNEAPMITTTETTASVPENSVAVLTFAATDVDASDTEMWSVESTDDGGLFTINQSTGALEFSNAPDFEAPNQSGSTNNTYVVTVKVTDGGSLSDTHTVTVTVTDVNETPEITSGPATITRDENTATTEIIATYVATDPDATTGTMTWDLQGNDAGDFRIESTVNGTANLYFAASPNFEAAADTGTDNTYDVTVRVRDNGSTRLQDTQGVTVTVEDVNEKPVISGNPGPDFAEIEYDATSPDLTIGTYTYTDEDRPADTITWGLSGTDVTLFEIGGSTGVLSFQFGPDFENPFGADNEYLIVVEADDGRGGVGTFPVTVTVTNVDETPQITTTEASHTAPSFMEIEYDAATADLTVADYDGLDEEGQTITWSKAGTDAGDFTIDPSTGVLSFAQRPDFEMPADGGGDNVYNVTVRASDTASPANVRELAVVVTVTDVNERPDIDENFNAPQTYMEIEYDFTGTRPDVHTFTATDYDAGDNVAWSLAGTDAAHLEIGATTGVLTFKQDSCTNDGPLPDFEEPCDDNADGSNTYAITVRATDDDATDQKFTDYAVVVTVTDVNEVPEFTGTPATAITLDEHDANTSYVVTDLADYDARDEEGGVTWSLTGTDRLDFAISADGVVTFAKEPNFEAPEDSGGDNVYEFTVVATDVQSGSSRRTVSQAVTVTVGDVEEAGTLSADNLSPAAGETVTFVLTDPDGGIDTSSMTWEIQSKATGESWTRVSGVLTPAATTFPWTVDEDVTGKRIRATVTYTDRRGSGKTAVSPETAEVTADAIANAPPRFRGDSSWSIDEGPAGRDVGTPTSATDRDNDTLTYGIETSLDSAFFEIDPATGQVRLAQAVDFETLSEPRVLFFYLTLHDGKGVDENNVEIADSSIDARRSASVFVTDVEEDGVVTLSTDEPEVDEELTATLEDGDGGVSDEAWQWARSQDGQTGWSNISGATSSSYTPTEADAEFFLRATVNYEDRRGDGKSAEAITAQRVLGENQPPTFPSDEDGQRTIAENTTAGANIGAPVAAEDPESDALTYSLTGTDAAAFTIVETTGQIRVKDALDFETKDSYSVTVEVHDRLDTVGNASTAVDDTQAVTITVENEEEPGVVTLSTDAETILARVEVVATLEDGDGSIANLTWQWARSPDGSTDWVNIQGATSAAYTPTLEEDPGNYIRATASYDDGHGSNKTAERVSELVGAPEVTVSRDTLSVVEGGMATYTVRLAFQPTESVTIDVTGGGDVTVDPTPLTFTADTWETPQTVTVRAGQDDDTADDTQTITHAVTGNSAPEYVGLSIDSVAVTVTDNDSPDVTVSRDTLSVNEGGSGSYTVRLTFQPTASVTIDVTGGGDVTVQPASLTFTADTWETPQTVTVRAAEDDDTADDAQTITHAVTGNSAPEYVGLSIDSVAVTVTDDDEPEVTVSTDILIVDEGSSGSYTVRLAFEPTDSVTIDVTGGGDVTVQPASLTFTADTWETPQTVTVRAAEDDDTVDDTRTITHEVDSNNSAPEYGGLSIDSVAVTVTDDDAPDVTVSRDTLSVDEGSSGSYTVRLAFEPTDSVTVDVTGGADVTVDPTSLTFTTDTWETPQTVTVRAAEDDDTVDDTQTITHEVDSNNSAPEYGGLSVDGVAVTVTDDDAPDVTVSSDTLIVVEGSSGSYTVRLAFQPTASVTIDVAGGGDVTVDPTSLTFTTDTWETPQTVTVRAAEDDDTVDDTQTIAHEVDSNNSAPEYGGLSIDGVAVAVTDNDVPGVSVSRPTLSVNEGGSETYTVRLTLEPTDSVTVNVTGGGDVTVDPTSLTFTADNWGDAQTITVRAAEDDDTADDTQTITHEVDSNNSAPEYVVLSVDSVAVTVTDSDVSGVSVSRSTLSIVEGGSGTYTVALDAQPTTGVTIDVTGGGDVTVDPDSLTFTTDTWETPQIVTVRAGEDDDTVDDTQTITHAVTSGSAPEYVLLSVDSVAVTVTDNDNPDVTVSSDALSVVEGGSGTYTVRLASQPTTGVTIDVTGGGDVTVQPTSLTFTADTWETAQTVTVRAAEDDDTSDDTETITHAVTSGSAPEYAGLSVDSVAVTVTDNDDPEVTVRFEYEAHALAEGSSVTVGVRLSEDPKRTVTIPLTVANQGGASSADYSGVPTGITFQSGETEQSFTFTAARDAVEDDGESVKLGFGPLPAMVTTGTTSEATLSIIDVGQVGDNRPPTVSARAERDTVYAGDLVTLRAIATDPEGDALTYLWTSDGGGAFAPRRDRAAGRLGRTGDGDGLHRQPDPDGD